MVYFVSICKQKSVASSGNFLQWETARFLFAKMIFFNVKSLNLWNKVKFRCSNVQSSKPLGNWALLPVKWISKFLDFLVLYDVYWGAKGTKWSVLNRLQIFCSKIFCLTRTAGRQILVHYKQCTMVRRGDKTYSVILSYCNIFALLGSF